MSKYKFVYKVIMSTLCVISCNLVYAQERGFYPTISLSIGIHDQISTAVNFPFNNSLTTGLKLGRIITGGGSNKIILKGYAVGITNSYINHESNYVVNTVKIDFNYMYKISGVTVNPSSGINTMITVGKQNTKSGLNIFWDIGVGLTTFNSYPTYVFPCIRIGYLYN